MLVAHVFHHYQSADSELLQGHIIHSVLKACRQKEPIQGQVADNYWMVKIKTRLDHHCIWVFGVFEVL